VAEEKAGASVEEDIMSKTKNGQEPLINRNQYNALKRMDRNEADDFLRGFMQKGYVLGASAAQGSPADFAEVFKTAMLDNITNIKGVGVGTQSRLAALLDEMCGWDAAEWDKYRGDAI